MKLSASFHGFFDVLLVAGGIGVCLQACLTLLSAIHPVIELAAHFSMHTMVGACVLLPLVLWRKMKRLGVCLGLATCILVWLTQPWQLLPTRPAIAEDYPSRLKVVCWNALILNQPSSAIEELLRQADPDVLVLIEIRPDLLKRLPALEDSYPYFHFEPAWAASGIAVFSRIPGSTFELKPFSIPHQPAVLATIPSSDGPPLQLVAMHTLSPMPIYRTRHRDRQLASLLAWACEQPGAICVCGDLNITPWAPMFRKLVQNGFVDSRFGSGNCASWPTELGPFGIPIDHALSLGPCRISDRQVLEADGGSDHFPIAFRVHF